MNELQNIVNVENIRGYIDQASGIVYLNLEDVCRGLGFTTTAPSGNIVVRWNRVQNYLLAIEKQGVATCGNGNVLQGVYPEYIPENVFYMLAMKANSTPAIAFQQKIANEILPMIRRTGMYMTDEVYNAFVSNPRNIVNIMTMYADAKDQIAILQPKADQYDAFMNCEYGYNMATASKILRFQAPQRKRKVIGRNQMFQILRDLNILQSTPENWNVPFQEYVDMGYFHTYGRPSNGGRSSKTVEVLPRGLDFICKLLLANGYELVPREPVPLVYDSLTEVPLNVVNY